MTAPRGPARAPFEGLAGALSEPEAGELFAGRFRLEREAGVGGMGVVYRARDEANGAPVALKVLRRSDEASVRRFAAEAEALERLRAPAVVRYVAHGVGDEGEAYLAMEWLEGESLGARLERGPLGVGEAVALGRRLCEALGAIHALGLVHRDLKPGNVMLVGGAIEGATLVDFGIARAATDPYVTMTGALVGTPGYMAPEQAKGLHDVDGRADLFSLGCVLFYGLAGREAFEGPEALTVLAKVILEEPPPLHALRPDVPAALEALVACLLEKDPARRPPTAAAVGEALEGAFGEPPATAPPVRVRSGRRVGAGLALAASLAAAAALLARNPAASFGRAPASLRPSAETPARGSLVPTTLADLSASAGCTPEAASSYRQGLQALRQANWAEAAALFAGAAEADPSCPEAQLRRLQTDEAMSGTANVRTQVPRALALRDRLGERDRFLLDALVALGSGVPPDRPAALRALDAGARRFPGDAELRQLRAYYEVQSAERRDELEAVIALAREAAALDPAYADPLQMQAFALRRLGRADEAIDALERCLRVAPGAADCVTERVQTLRQRGRCDEALAQVRNGLALAPNSTLLYGDLVDLLGIQGAPREALEEALGLRWSRLTPDVREASRLRELGQLDLWEGDFESALRRAGELERLVAGQPLAAFHLAGERLAVEALAEAGRGGEAARRAERSLRRVAAWDHTDVRRLNLLTHEPQLFAFVLEHGRMTPAAWRQATADWERGVEPMLSATERWALRWGAAVGPRLDAAEALRSEPRPAPEQPALSVYGMWHIGTFEALEGRLRLRGGDAASAAPLLETAARSCQGVTYSLANTRTHLWLGQARETLGDVASACDAYGVVAKRWGRAKPRSVTAEEAARRRKALGCAG